MVRFATPLIPLDREVETLKPTSDNRHSLFRIERAEAVTYDA